MRKKVLAKSVIENLDTSCYGCSLRYWQPSKAAQVHQLSLSLSFSLSLSSTHSLSHTLAHTYMRTKAGVAGCCVICRWDQKQQTLLYLFNNFGILSLFLSLSHTHTQTHAQPKTCTSAQATSAWIEQKISVPSF